MPETRPACSLPPIAYGYRCDALVLLGRDAPDPRIADLAAAFDPRLA